MEKTTKPLFVNVGGRTFQTTRSTLELSPTLRDLLKNLSDEELIPFIDRDPTGFEHVLRKLRDDSYRIPPEWEYELDFYGLSQSVSEEKTNPSDVLPPLPNKDLICYLNQVQATRGCGEYEYHQYKTIEHVDIVLELKAEIVSNTRSVFRIPRSIDVLICVLYDFNGGEIKRGTFYSSLSSWNAEGIQHFPTYIRVANSPFTDMRIEVEGRLEILHLLVREYLKRELREKERDQTYVDLSNNISTKRGETFNVFADDDRLWMKKRLYDQ